MIHEVISREFSGLARQFLGTLDVAALVASPAIKRLQADTLKYYEALGGSRSDVWFVKETEARWFALPADGRLSVGIVRGVGKRTVTLTEARLVPSMSHDPLWPNSDREPSICVVQSSLALAKSSMAYESAIVASIGFHALSQFFRRGFQRSDGRLLEELARISVAVPSLIAAGRPFTLPSALGGDGWRGCIDPMESPSGIVRLGVNVRTFV